MQNVLLGNDILFRTLVDNLSEGVYITDTERRIAYWNKSAVEITGFGADEVMGHSCADNILIHIDENGKSLCKGLCPLAASMNDREIRSAKVFLHHKEGHRMPVFVTTMPVLGEDNAVIGGLEIFHDATEEMGALKQMEELKAQSLLCPLTGVGNRRAAEQMLQQKFDEMNRNNATVGLVFIDIDHFKTINDKYGHQAGDIVLKMVARTLAHAMRTYDFLARGGGEEFVAILPNLHRPQLETFAERLRVLVEKSSLKISKGLLAVTISLGAVIASPNDSVDDIMEQADALMYKSKAQGRNRVTIA